MELGTLVELTGQCCVKLTYCALRATELRYCHPKFQVKNNGSSLDWLEPNTELTTARFAHIYMNVKFFYCLTSSSMKC